MRIVVLVVIAFCLFALLAYPLYMNLVSVQSDLGRYHLPIRDFYQKCLHNGDDPHWCPQLFCGFDIHGEGQGGFDHPWHRFLYTFVPLVPAFNIEVFINYPLLCLGMYLFLRRHDISHESSLIGALWFTYSGFTIPHYSHTNAIAIIAHIPWLLWATDIQFTSPSFHQRCAATSAIALLTGSQLLLGYPQYVLFSGIAEGLYVVMLIGRDRKWSAMVWWFAAKLIGVAVGGAQLLPTLQALQLSPRMSYDRHFRGMGSLPPRLFLAQFFLPTGFNEFMQMCEYTVYAGMLATFAGLWWIASRRWQSRSVLDRWACWLVIIAIPLALGNNTPLYSIYVKLPILGVFRFPCRYLVLFHLAAAIAVVRLTERLRQCREHPWTNRQILLCLVVPAWAFMMAVNAEEAGRIQMAGQELWNYYAAGSIVFVGAAISLVVAILLIATNAVVPGALLLLFLVSFADVAYFNFRTLELPPLQKLGLPVTNTYQFVDWATYLERQSRPPTVTAGRVDVPDAAGNGLMTFGDQLTRGYVGLSPPKVLDYNSAVVQQIAGTKWQSDGVEWKAIEGLPPARMLTDVRVSADPKKDIETIDIKTTALVDTQLELEPGTQGSAAISEERPGRLVVVTKAETKQLLVVAQSFHPGWRALLDGKPTPIIRVNGDFTGVIVQAGGHRVVFSFDSPWRWWGRGFSWFGLGLAGTIYLVGLILGIGKRPS